VPDAIFDEPRLAGLYDLLERERPDLRHYLEIAQEFGAQRVLDIGCGTGTFACLLAQHGIEVIGVDPAAASIGIAREKPFAERVHWVLGDASATAAKDRDLVTMTGNVAQVFLTESTWSSTLRAAHGALQPRGRLVFEVRDPTKEGWRAWTREATYRRLELPQQGDLETWIDLIEVAPPLVSFRHHFIFADGTTLVSDSTLRFRGQTEIIESLADAGFTVEETRDAPDRPGLELVFIARRCG
jgi:ubiquinone/menaquinone biosynthesis C-methylase UbiE